MANITLKDFISSSITGVSLFNDSESFMQDLSENEVNLQGGLKQQRIKNKSVVIL